MRVRENVREQHTAEGKEAVGGQGDYAQKREQRERENICCEQRYSLGHRRTTDGKLIGSNLTAIGGAALREQQRFGARTTGHYCGLHNVVRVGITRVFVAEALRRGRMWLGRAWTANSFHEAEGIRNARVVVVKEAWGQ